MTDRTTLIRGLIAAQPARADGTTGFLQRMCQAAARTLSASGVGVSLWTEGGVRAVFAFPLQVGSARLGVLDVFRERVGALSADQVADALTFADVTVSVLLDQQEDAHRRGADDELADAVESRAELFQAQGMVMVQIGGTISEAIARLRAYAYAEGRDLSDIARDVVARRLRFDQDHP